MYHPTKSEKGFIYKCHTTGMGPFTPNANVMYVYTPFLTAFSYAMTCNVNTLSLSVLCCSFAMVMLPDIRIQIRYFYGNKQIGQALLRRAFDFNISRFDWKSLLFCNTMEFNLFFGNVLPKFFDAHNSVRHKLETLPPLSICDYMFELMFRRKQNYNYDV